MPDFVHVKHDLRVCFIGPELFRDRESESLLGYQAGEPNKIYRIVAMKEGEAQTQTLVLGKVYCNSKRG